jgi:hypothetical protein
VRKPIDVRTEEGALYTIEADGGGQFWEYRYVSLVNGARGPWRYGRGSALEDGEAHGSPVQSVPTPSPPPWPRCWLRGRSPPKSCKLPRSFGAGSASRTITFGESKRRLSTTPSSHSEP